MNARFKNVLHWLLLALGLAAGVIAWLSSKNEKLGSVLIVIAYASVLTNAFFFKPKAEWRKNRLMYIGYATILVFWVFLSFAAFAK